LDCPLERVVRLSLTPDAAWPELTAREMGCCLPTDDAHAGRPGGAKAMMPQERRDATGRHFAPTGQPRRSVDVCNPDAQPEAGRQEPD